MYQNGGRVRLYKYCDERGIQIFKNSSIKVSSPSELNDPFDCKPVPDTWSPESVAELKRQITQSSDLGRSLLAGILHPKLPFGTDLRKAKQDWLDTLDRTVRNHEEVMRHMELSYAGVAIICLTELKNHHLMWAHYANSHQGMVIELESDGVFKSPEEATYTNRLYCVDYAEDRPIFRFDGISPGAFTTKGTVWQHEKEWRVLYFSSQFDVQNIGGRDIRLRPIPPECIKTVYMGCMITASNRNSLIELVNQDRWKHIKVFQMRLNPKSFEIHEEPILH